MCLWSGWEGRRRHDREVSVDLCMTWPESWCKRLSREMTWSSCCSGGITLTVLRMDGWGLEGLWTVKVTWARVRMFWTRAQELEEGGSGGNWDIFWKWSQHYSPSQWGQEQVKKRRTSGDPMVFVKIDGRMGLPPTEMGEGTGGTCLGRKIKISPMNRLFLICLFCIHWKYWVIR